VTGRFEPWNGRGPLGRALLRAASGLYGLGWRLNQALAPRRPTQAGLPVVSVGNLSVGGTGKSLVVRLVAGRARELGLEPAVLLRGYKAVRGPRPLNAADPAAQAGLDEAGDEALEHVAEGIRQVWVDPERRRSAAAARLAGAACLILDDGFQRRRHLARDLEVLLADFGQLALGEHLLPAGPWREPWSQAALAGAVLVGGAPSGLEGAALEAVLPPAWRGKPTFRLDRVPVSLRSWGDSAEIPLVDLKGRRVLALSGLGSPEGFEASLAGLGAEVLPWRFADHHRYRLDELKKIPGTADFVVTTAKDAVRLPQGFQPGMPVRVLRVRAEVRPLAPFIALVDAALRRPAAGREP